MDNSLAQIPARNMIALREEFSANERRLSAEMSAIVLAARAKAEVESRYIYAERHQRDMDDVRIRLLADCDRYDFAKAARYKIPNRGEGFTIRFIERVLDLMGNVYAPSYVIYEDDERRTIRTAVLDLERNVTWEKDVTVTKTVERADVTGREVVRYRAKADGSTIAIVRATDEELLTKEASATSKAQRTNGQRLVPPGLLEEAKSLIEATMQKKAKDDPDGERKAIADAFASLGVLPSHLKAYLGVELGQVSPAELVKLRELFTAIREGHTTWREIMIEKQGAEPTSTATATESNGKPSSTATLKEKIRRTRTPKETPTQKGDSAQAGESRQSAVPESSPAPNSEPSLFANPIEALRSKVSPRAFAHILGKSREVITDEGTDARPNGFATPEEVTPDFMDLIIFDLEDEIARGKGTV